jgi:tRNA 2-thiouridine synthesizing protein A
MSGGNTKQAAPARTVDVTGSRCPMTFVHVKAALEDVEAGQVLEFIVSEGEQIQDVPRNIKQEGHCILKVGREGEKFRLLVRKGQA